MDEAQTGARSWWTTMPGVLTAIAGVITAVGGLLAILVQAGFIGKPSAAPPAPAERAATHPTPAPDVRVPAPANAPQTAGAGVATPAEVVAGLRAREFKRVAVTHRDGSVVELLPDIEITDRSSIRLASGQSVSFDKLVAVEVDQPYDGNITLLLVNGQRLPAKLGGSRYLSGRNELGRYNQSLSNLRRIEFVR